MAAPVSVAGREDDETPPQPHGPARRGRDGYGSGARPGRTAGRQAGGRAAGSRGAGESGGGSAEAALFHVPRPGREGGEGGLRPRPREHGAENQGDQARGRQFDAAEADRQRRHAGRRQADGGGEEDAARLGGGGRAAVREDRGRRGAAWRARKDEAPG